jgi:hypothetical protein
VSSSYDYALSGSAARTLLGSPKKLRRKAEQYLNSLAADPFQEPDFTESAPSGRKFLVFVKENIVITLWVDHASKEVRIVRVEFI